MIEKSLDSELAHAQKRNYIRTPFFLEKYQFSLVI